MCQAQFWSKFTEFLQKCAQFLIDFSILIEKCVKHSFWGGESEKLQNCGYKPPPFKMIQKTVICVTKEDKIQ